MGQLVAIKCKSVCLLWQPDALMSNTMSAIVYQVHRSNLSYLPKKLIRRIPKIMLANLSVVESIQENLMEKDKCLTGTGPSFNQFHSGYLQKMHHKHTCVTA